MTKQNGFRFRAFVSLLTAFTFIAIALTGIVLYITPPGRIANWTNWTFWGLSKHQWGALHICFSAFFLIASVLHVWLNFKALKRHFVSKAKTVSGFRTEWIAAIAVCGVVIAGSLKPFAPFSSLMDLSKRIKFSWAIPQQQPPIPHAEILTIAELAKKSDIAPETIVQNLNAGGINAELTDVFGTVAEQHNMSPNKLFSIATDQQSSPTGTKQRGGHGGGFGQKTLKTACGEMNLDVDQAIDILKSAGIESTPDKTIRQIADENGIHPSTIRQLLH